MSGKIAVLATLDTKGQEADYVRQQIALLGGETVLVDLGVVGEPTIAADITREEIAKAGGKPLKKLLDHPTRQEAQKIYGIGVSKILAERVASGELGAVLGMGGTQGTSICGRIMQSLPYGFPKVLVSTVASGDCSPFVDIKDINMFFSVSDILGLNPITRMVLANAAGAAWGMAQVAKQVEAKHEGKAVIGITNLGVLTKGAMRAQERIEAAGHEVIVFHAVGSGGRAMEQMMREGLITAVFDYALGDIADDNYGGLRACGPTRLTVAGDLGLPQVICPGGSEHLGIFVKEPNHVPDEYADYTYTFHSPVVFVPRLRPAELEKIAKDIGQRLQHTKGKAKFFIPLGGTSRYGVEGGELRDPEGDKAYFEMLKEHLPKSIEVVEIDAGAEDDKFVDAAVDALLGMI